MGKPLINFPVIIFRETGSRHISAQCDCACATDDSVQPCMDYHTSDFTKFHVNNSFMPIHLKDNYYAVNGKEFVFTIVNSNTLDILNDLKRTNSSASALFSYKSGWDKTEIHGILNKLIKSRLLIPDTCPEFIPDYASNILTAWIHVTDQCNLRCSYCYLPHIQNDMSLHTGKAAIDAVFRSAVTHNYKKVKIKYAGGEPLLRFDFIIELHKYAKNLSERHNINFDGIILSNGTLLTEKMVNCILSNNIRLMISLDGLEQYQDCQRHYSDGQGSFKTVSKAIKTAISNKLIPDISITVSGRNADGLPELISWILDHDLPFRINLYRKNPFSLSKQDLQIEEDRIIDGLLNAYRIIESNTGHKRISVVGLFMLIILFYKSAY